MVPIARRPSRTEILIVVVSALTLSSPALHRLVIATPRVPRFHRRPSR